MRQVVSIDDVLAVVSRPDDPELNELVGLAADLCGAEAAGLTVLSDGEYHVTVARGVQPMVYAASDTFCIHTMTTDGVYHVEDAPADPRFAGIGWVDGTFASTRFYASAPVYDPEGDMVGRLCVIDSQPKGLTPLQERALRALGSAVTRLIALRLRQPESDTEDTEGPAPVHASMTMMSHLAAELSHDLRVPLTSIMASVELLREELSDNPDGGVIMLLQRASAAADRMSRMLEQVRHFGSVDDHPELMHVDLRKLVGQVVLDSATLLESSGGRVVIGDLPVVRADPDEMYSLFQNLITNSVKFARPEVPPVVDVTAEAGKGRWLVRVADNGIGIPVQRRADVFTLFSRVDPAVEGHGIGLATAARIVNAHGGSIRAERAPGGGTAIAFDLPAV